MRYIPRGSIPKIIAHLQEETPEITALDAIALRFIGLPQHGWIDVGRERMTHADFLYRISHNKAALRSVTLIPGETTWVFFGQLAERFELDREKLFEALKRRRTYDEGNFVPETYRLPMGIDEEEAISILLDYADRKFRAWSYKIFGTYNEHKWFHYVTMASIIQKEAASEEEMPLVASVIVNRLAKEMPLQMDGSLNYGSHSHEKITAKRIRSDASRYNTYKYRGLPPVPVCNVGLEAIRAAIFPAQTDYLYFVKGSDGKHKFSRYYSTHKLNISYVTE